MATQKHSAFRGRKSKSSSTSMAKRPSRSTSSSARSRRGSSSTMKEVREMGQNVVSSLKSVLPGKMKSGTGTGKRVTSRRKAPSARTRTVSASVTPLRGRRVSSRTRTISGGRIASRGSAGSRFRRAA